MFMSMKVRNIRANIAWITTSITPTVMMRLTTSKQGLPALTTAGRDVRAAPDVAFTPTLKG